MKRKIGLLIIGFFFFINCSAQQGWSYLPSCPVSFRYDDLYFFNKDTGIAVPQGGTAIKTTDGGVTWNFIPTANNGGRSLEFINNRIGFIGKLNSNKTLLKTEDGGDTWFSIDSLISDSIKAICGLSAADHQTICGVGSFFGSAYFIKSIDSGKTWISKDMSAYIHALIDIKFFSADTGFITGSNEDTTIADEAIILSTFDGGLTWQERARFDVGFTDQIWKIEFPTRMVGYASIQSYMCDSFFIAKTIDGGLTWNKIYVTNNQDHFYFQGIGFINENIGWVGGWFDGFYETRDGGNNWTYYNFGSEFDRFFKLNDTLLFGSGHQVYKFNLNSTSVPTGINSQYNHNKLNDLISIYPNPVRSKAKAKYMIGEDFSNVEFGIYDIKGKLIKEIFLKTQLKGEYETEFSVEGIPTGNYFLVLKTDYYYYPKKIVVMRK